MTPLTTERLFWRCGAHTAEPNIGTYGPIPPIAYYQYLRFSVARGGTGATPFWGHFLGTRLGDFLGNELYLYYNPVKTIRSKLPGNEQISST